MRFSARLAATLAMMGLKLGDQPKVKEYSREQLVMPVNPHRFAYDYSRGYTRHKSQRGDAAIQKRAAKKRANVRKYGK